MVFRWPPDDLRHWRQSYLLTLAMTDMLTIFITEVAVSLAGKCCHGHTSCSYIMDVLPILKTLDQGISFHPSRAAMKIILSIEISFCKAQINPALNHVRCFSKCTISVNLSDGRKLGWIAWTNPVNLGYTFGFHISHVMHTGSMVPSPRITPLSSVPCSLWGDLPISTPMQYFVWWNIWSAQFGRSLDRGPINGLVSPHQGLA